MHFPISKVSQNNIMLKCLALNYFGGAVDGKGWSSSILNLKSRSFRAFGFCWSMLKPRKVLKNLSSRCWTCSDSFRSSTFSLGPKLQNIFARTCWHFNPGLLSQVCHLHFFTDLINTPGCLLMNRKLKINKIWPRLANI